VVDAFADGSGLPPWSLLALGAVVIAVKPYEQLGRAAGRELIPVLVGTARLQGVFGSLLAIGLWIAW